MKEELRKIYLEFVTGMVKTLLRMSGGDWITLFGNEDSLTFSIVKHGNEENSEQSETLIHYSTLFGEVVDECLKKN